MKAKLAKAYINVFNRYGVSLVFLFGSQVAGLQRPESDMDIGIVFHDERDRLQNPVEIYGTLYELFQKLFPSKTVDLVYLREGSYLFQFRVVMDGALLYASSPTTYADYREEVLRHYLDFKPVEDAFDQAFLGQP